MPPKSAKLSNRDPRVLLQDMMGLLAREVSDLQKRQKQIRAQEGDDETHSKQLQRLAASMSRLLKDVVALDKELRAEAQGASDLDVIGEILADGPTRRAIITQLEGRGYTVKKTVSLAKGEVQTEPVDLMDALGLAEGPNE